MIKGIVFDLDGVYFVNGKDNFIKAVADLGVNEEEVRRVFLQSREMNELYKTGEWSDQQFWQWAAAEWKLDQNVDLPALMTSGYEINQPVIDLLRQLRKNGYKTLVCSNNFPARVDGLQAKFKFLDDFDAVSMSYEVGETKPSEKIYNDMIVKSGLQAEEIAYADDKDENIAAAERLGIRAFKYTDYEKFVNDLLGLSVKMN